MQALVVATQRHARLQALTKYSKVEVLQSYWKTLVSAIAKRSNERGDAVKSDLEKGHTKVVKELVSSILQIPPAVQIDCLKHYIRRCKQLHAIAFL